MACPESVSLCFKAGDTITIDWQYTANDSVTPVDLTGATAEMQLLEKITDAAAFKVMNGGLTDHANGLGQFFLSEVESQALLPVVQDQNISKAFVSVIKITFADTTTKTIAGVNVTIEQGGIR